MDSYIDIHLLPDPEFAQNQLMNALFAKLHRALAQRQTYDIGVSFPRMRSKPRTLGDHLRLHGSAQALQALMVLDWLSGMRDHTNITALQPVPAGARYRVVRRVQSKSNPERLRRRLAKRHGLTEEQTHERIPETMESRMLDLPFIALRSQSTGQNFRLFVEQGEPQEQPLTGTFTAYGLSNGATVPWF
ncbi:type I-F CRISPR-associated endoribonuclease Cas6/Csy4 [Azorhizophilus paspali]|uniref:Type I-F CRISPR-associated endoribonuclease Cas6/Csy4 n=1 Tax=Azorhizophilus paspali TaxID=69963 RepID=A0ABV6SNV6_AZOPA